MMTAFTVLLLAAPTAARAASCVPTPESDRAHAARALGSIYMLGIGKNGGAGYVVDPRGYLITNEHVAARAKRLRGAPGDPDPRVLELCRGLEECSATEITPDGRVDPSRLRVYAEVVALDAKSDLALMRVITDKGLAALPWSAAAGEGGVVAVRAVPEDWGAVTAGRVRSRTVRRLPPGHESMDLKSVAVWMSDVDTKPGHSGTPLLDRCDGGVMGTVFGGKGRTASDGETYFTPASEARRLWERSAAAVTAAEARVGAPGYWDGIKARIVADMERALREMPPPPKAAPRR